jgi:hypothetical protein
VAHDYIRSEVSTLLKCIQHGVAPPREVLEFSAGDMRLLRGASSALVNDFVDARCAARRPLCDESAAKTILFREPLGDMPKLRWEILVDIEDVHGSLLFGPGIATGQAL